MCTIFTMKTKSLSSGNISHVLKNGKPSYFVHVMIDGKRYRGYRKTLSEAKDLLTHFKSLKPLAFKEVANLSSEQLADVLRAIRALPSGLTLTECVQSYLKHNVSTKKLSDCIDEFKALKEQANLSADYLGAILPRLERLKTLGDFSDASPSAILNFVKSLQKSQKTKIHYLTIYKEFFAWCKAREFVAENPFDKIHPADFPKLKNPNPQIPTIDAVKRFFETAERKAPQFVGIFALVAFGGFRNAEAQRLLPENFDFKNRRITLQKQLSKTGQNWLQEGMPSNLWAWLEAYKPSKIWNSLKKSNYQSLNYDKLIPHNGLRHAFATYHLSLFRDAPKTSLLMRHTDPRTLWQNYLGGLVAEEEAAKYFKILPKNYL